MKPFGRTRRSLRHLSTLIGALCLGAGSAHAADTVFYTTNYPACNVRQCPPHSLAFSTGQYDQIYLVDNGGAVTGVQPLTLAPEALATVLETLQYSSEGKTQHIFQKQAAASFAKGLSIVMAKARPQQDALFMITSSGENGGLADISYGNSGRAWLDQKGLNLVFAEIGIDFASRWLATYKVHEFDFASHSQPSAVTLAGDGLEHPRRDWVVIPLLTQVDPTTGRNLIIPVISQTRDQNGKPIVIQQQPSPYPLANPTGTAAAAPAAAPAAPVVAAPAAIPADAAERRLTTLQRLRDKGLISEQEYQEKRKAVLDGI